MNRKTVSGIMLAALLVSILICVFPQTLQVGLALESPLKVTLKELKTNSDRYVNKTIEVTGEIVGISLVCPHDTTHRIYSFSDGTDVVGFLWFPELLSGRYKAVGNLTYYSGPIPPFDVCADWVKGVVWWVTPEGYYWWRIELTPLPEIAPVAELEHLKEFIDGLPDDAFDKPKLASQKKNALFNKIDEVILKVEASNYTDAINKLLHDIRAKMDGDSTAMDWIMDSETQVKLCVIIDHIISSIETLQD